MESFIREELIRPNGPFPGSTIKTISPVTGGSIHNAWRIQLENDKYFFAKTTSKTNINMLIYESNGLNALSSFTNQSFLEIPKPLGVYRLESIATLIMPWIELSQGNQFQLGKGLAFLHKKSSKSEQNAYGWESDGFIGSNPQPGGWKKKWGDCFVTLRLIPQINIAKKWGLKLHEKDPFLLDLMHYLNQHNPEISLVHGDLWSGNAGVIHQDKGIIFDPACWWADREVDIAMTRLFGGFSKDFYAAYNETWALKSDSDERVAIYNLYHLLNHANLFRGSYIEQAIETMKEIKKLW